MKRALSSLAIGGAFVAAVTVAFVVLHRHGGDRLFPDCFVLPGIYVGMFAPDSHVNFSENFTPGPIAIFVMWAANVILYSGVAYVVLWLTYRVRRVLRPGAVSSSQGADKGFEEGR